MVKFSSKVFLLGVASLFCWGTVVSADSTEYPPSEHNCDDAGLTVSKGPVHSTNWQAGTSNGWSTSVTEPETLDTVTTPSAIGITPRGFADLDISWTCNRARNYYNDALHWSSVTYEHYCVDVLGGVSYYDTGRMETTSGADTLCQVESFQTKFCCKSPE